MPHFQGTTPTIEVASQATATLAEAWTNYEEMRMIYADRLLNYNWAHRGGKNDASPARRTARMSEAYDNYFEALDTLKLADRAYKKAFRHLLQNHLL